MSFSYVKQDAQNADEQTCSFGGLFGKTLWRRQKHFNRTDPDVPCLQPPPPVHLAGLLSWHCSESEGTWWGAKERNVSSL